SPGSDRVELEVAVVDDSNRIVPLGTVRDFVTREVATRYRGRRGQSTTFQRFSPRASIVVWNSIVAISTGESGIIELRDPTGNATQALTLPLKRRAVSDEMRAAQIATELEFVRMPRTEQRVDPRESERLVREAPYADSLP